MKVHFKKTLSQILAVLLTISMLPMQAYAYEVKTAIEETQNYKNTDYDVRLLSDDFESVAVNGIVLDKETLELTVGDEPVVLTATISPEDATDKSVTWTSSSDSVATVADGKVTPVAMGEAMITATTTDGNFAAQCNVKVYSKCGENTKWFLSNNVLTISGNGPMEDYDNVRNRGWFSNQTKITSVIVEEGVESIGKQAFYGFSKLTAIELPTSLKSIGSKAFFMANAMTSITLPEGIQTISDDAFASKLTTINYLGTAEEWLALSYTEPSAVKVYDRDGNLIERTQNSGNCGVDGANVTWSFDEATGVLTITGSGEMKDFTSTTLPWKELKNSVTAVEVTGSVAKIGGYAFSGCTSLKRVTLAESVATIGKNAFMSDTALESINLEKISAVEENAFTGCAGIKTVTLESASSIGAGAFGNCTSLESVVLGSADHRISVMGIRAFQDCSSLKTVEFANVESISDYAFMGTSLTEADLNRVSAVGEQAFREVTTLESVILGDDLKAIGARSFEGTGLVRIIVPGSVERMDAAAFAACANLVEAELEEGITEIPSAMFNGAAALETVTIPVSVTTVGTYAFYGCEKLTTVNYAGTTAQWDSVNVGDNNEPLTALMTKDPEPAAGTVDLTKFKFTLSNTNSTPDYNYDQLNVEKISDTEYVIVAPVNAVYSATSKIAEINIEAPDDCSDSFSVVYTAWANVDGDNSCLGEQTVASENGKAVVKNYYDRSSPIDRTLRYSDFQIIFDDSGDMYHLTLSLYNELTRIVVQTTESSDMLPVTYIGNSTYAITLTRGQEYRIGASSPLYGHHFLPRSDHFINGVSLIDTETKDFRYTPGDETEKDFVITIANSDETLNIAERQYILHVEVEAPAENPPVFSEYVATINGQIVQATANSAGTTYTLNITQYDDLSLKVVSDNIGEEVTYKWMQGIVPAKRITLSETSDTLVIDTTSTRSTDYYFVCEVTSNGASYTSPVFRCMVTALKLEAPVISKQPEGAEYEVGETSQRISVELKDSVRYYNYQWFTCDDESGINAQAIEGANDSFYFPSTTAAGSTWYFCEIVEKKGELTSDKTTTDIVEIKVTQPEKLWEGEGTEADPFILSSEADLVKIRDAVAKGMSCKGQFFRFAGNISRSTAWTPIGTLKEGTTSPANGVNLLPFSGNIDGAGHTLEIAAGGKPLFNYVREASVKNLSIYGTKIEGYGLVDCYTVDYGADGDYWNTGVPETIAIDNCHILSGSQIKYSGFLGGYASGMNIVRISNCTVANDVIIGYGMANIMPDGQTVSTGSLAGDFNGYVTNCSSAATVMGTTKVGGLIGAKGQSMGPCTVSESSFTGTVSSNGSAGGIIGSGYTSANSPCVTIEDCSVTGTIRGNGEVGGILGKEGEITQSWDNGIGGICNNEFTGKIEAEGQFVGGIVGYFCSLNVCNRIENNYYSTECGADRGIGFVKYVDTNCSTHETSSGTLYFDSSKELPNVPGIIKQNHNRSDDPLGADKEKLCRTDKPTEPIVTKLTVTGYKTEYMVGDSFDTMGIAIQAIWSDGKTTNPAIGEVKFSGFDSSEAGKKLITVEYSGTSALFTIEVRPKSATITVTISVFGDIVHNSDEDGNVHGGNKLGGLTCWLGAKTYEADSAEPLWTVLKKALDENNISYSNPSGNYIESVNGLAEFTNGKNSGWVYTLNGRYPDLGVSQQYLNNGDVIILHYTDDYIKDGISMGQETDDEKAEAVERLIEAIGEVSLESEAAIQEAREAYDALTEEQKALVSEETLAKLISAEEKLEELKNQTPEPPAAKDVSDIFKDVRKDTWYHDYVQYVYDHGIMTGMKEDVFAPASILGRAQFATVIWRMEGSPKVSYEKKFKDVPNGAWYTDAVMWASEAGIITGYTAGAKAGCFGPADSATREQMALMMYRYANYKGYDTQKRGSLGSFSDAGRVSSFAKEAMEWAVGCGIISGKDNETRLDPQGKTSRAETAAIITRFSKAFME